MRLLGKLDLASRLADRGAEPTQDQISISDPCLFTGVSDLKTNHSIVPQVLDEKQQSSVRRYSHTSISFLYFTNHINIFNIYVYNINISYSDLNLKALTKIPFRSLFLASAAKPKFKLTLNKI